MDVEKRIQEKCLLLIFLCKKKLIFNVELFLRYAMKCLDKKRIKMKQGESLALNERIMLSSVSNGDGSPFIVCMTYAFHTVDKLCFILDLMNGNLIFF